MLAFSCHVHRFRKSITRSWERHELVFTLQQKLAAWLTLVDSLEEHKFVHGRILEHGLQCKELTSRCVSVFVDRTDETIPVTNIVDDLQGNAFVLRLACKGYRRKGKNI